MACHIFITTLWSGENGWYFGDNISKCIVLNEDICVLIIFTDVLFWRWNWQQISVGFINVLVPNRWQAITRICNDPIQGHKILMTLVLSTHWHRDKKGWHIADDIFKDIFVNENIPINISLKFVPNGPINNIPALFKIMAWRRPGDKPLSEPMMVSLLTHICITHPQWVYIII